MRNNGEKTGKKKAPRTGEGTEGLPARKRDRYCICCVCLIKKATDTPTLQRIDNVLNGLSFLTDQIENAVKQKM